MSSLERIKAYIHWAEVNPNFQDESVLLMAADLKNLIRENAVLVEALEKIVKDDGRFVQALAYEALREVK